MSDLLTTYTQLPSDDVTATHTALVIHGILGSRRNWQSYVRRLLDAHPEWRFVLVDLRNHGDAPAASPPHTLHACADDLRRLMDHLGLRPDVVMGHSFGGKVALAYGEQYPDHVDEIWVLDATPGPRCPAEALAGPEAKGEVQRVIGELRTIDMPLPSREALVDRLRGKGFSDTLAKWMTTNLTRTREGFQWRFDLDGVEAMLADYFRADYWPFLEAMDAGFPGPAVKVVRAALSDRWTDDILARFDALDGGRISLHTLADAGHWVHVDNPGGLAEMISPWLDDLT